eukprot:1158760-Pelagomonas_calceolata.AAC.5
MPLPIDRTKLGDLKVAAARCLWTLAYTRPGKSLSCSSSTKGRALTFGKAHTFYSAYFYDSVLCPAYLSDGLAHDEAQKCQ